MLWNTEISAVNTEQEVITTILLEPVIECNLGKKWVNWHLKHLIQKHELTTTISSWAMVSTQSLAISDTHL